MDEQHTAAQQRMYREMMKTPEQMRLDTLEVSLAQLRNDITPLTVLTRELLECWAAGKAPDAELVAETMAALAKVTGGSR